MKIDSLAAKIFEHPGEAHFVGAGGVGMAGVALLLKCLGWRVSGCDSKLGDTAAWLAANGVALCEGHSPAHISALDPARGIIVRTPAVPDSAPEIAAAAARGIPIFRRGEALAAITRRVDTLAICGTHGKTTTSTLAASILKKLAPESAAWCIGGTSRNLPAVAGVGAAGLAKRGASAQAAPAECCAPARLVIEADESDGTLALYSPFATVLTNIDPDHLEHFSGIEELESAFASALAATRRRVIYCADHPRAAAVAHGAWERVASASPSAPPPAPPSSASPPPSPAPSPRLKPLSFGFAKSADWRITDFAENARGIVFTLTPPPECAPECAPSSGGDAEAPRSQPASAVLRLAIPGRHNALNAAAAAAAACELGFAFHAVCRALSETAALPARRFELIGNPCGFAVVSDYSHHPEEIAALVRTAKTVFAGRRLLAIFEPHRYTRTRALGADFPAAFAGVDELALCPVYAASEPPLAGGTSADLYAQFRKAAAADARIPIPVLARSLAEAEDFARAILRPGDAVLCVGAGDIGALAPRLAAAPLPSSAPEFPRIGGYGVPAPALGGIEEVATRTRLAAVAESGPFHILGAGTNTFPAPAGCRAKIVRLAGAGFDFIKRDGDAALQVGASASGARLLAFCRDNGLSGLEFMTGIPGACGGWLAMNAGTRDGCFCDAVESVAAMSADGKTRELSRADLNASYRSCPGLKGLTAMAMTLRLRPAPPEEIAAAMRAASLRRFDFGGLRTCGSVFKNPPAGPSAGQILDAAGCKGLRIGGAFVSDRHANIIAADSGATASDILALMEIMRARALAASGIALELEVRMAASAASRK